MSAQDQPPGEGWWKASDGNWYAPHLHPDAQGAPNPPAPAVPHAPDGTAPPATPEPSGRGKTWLLGLGALAVIAAVAVAAFVVLGGDDDEAVDDVLTGEELWRADLDVVRGLDDEDFDTAPELLVAQDGVVVVGPPLGVAGDIVALDMATGEVLWDRFWETDGFGATAPPLVIGDTLLFASVDDDRARTSEWQAVGLTGGERRWRMDDLEPVATSVGDGRVMLFSREDGPVVVDVESGDELWSARQRGLFAGVHRNVVALAQFGDGDDDSSLVVFDTQTGEELWSTDLDIDFDFQRSVAVRGQPANEDVELLLVQSVDELIAFEASSGVERWRTQLFEEDNQALVEPSSGVIVVCGDDGDRDIAFRVIDGETGELRWDLSVDTDDDIDQPAVISVDEEVIVIGDGLGGCLSFSDFVRAPVVAHAMADGTELWRDDEGFYLVERPFGEALVPARGDTTTFVREDDGERSLIDLRTGDILASAAADPDARDARASFAGTTVAVIRFEAQELVVADRPPIDLPGIGLRSWFVDGVFYVATTGGHVVAVD